MKRHLLLCLWAAVAAGCVTEQGGEFEPTRPGYYLYDHAAAPLLGAMNDVWPVFAFIRYWEAETDEERERIHDLFFYTQRIVCEGNLCRIICDRWELAIDTGGRPLSEAGACWTFRYAGRDDSDPGDAPRLCAPESGDSRYVLHWPAAAAGDGFGGEFRVAAILETTVSAPGVTTHCLYLHAEGRGSVRAPDIDIDFETTQPLVYRPLERAFGSGALRLTTTADGKSETAEASILSPAEVRIDYNGTHKIWPRYGSYFCYE